MKIVLLEQSADISAVCREKLKRVVKRTYYYEPAVRRISGVVDYTVEPSEQRNTSAAFHTVNARGGIIAVCYYIFAVR